MFSFCFFFFKQKTAYEMRISDWSSDVCSSDLHVADLVSCSSRPTAPDAGNQVCDVVRRRFLDDAMPEIEDRRPSAELLQDGEIGRASGRERVCKYVYNSVLAVSFKNNNIRKRSIRQHIKVTNSKKV